MARLLLPVKEPRTRIDAATWGTMGVGLGSAIAAAVVHYDRRPVIAVEGDSAFGFSGMELETMVRWVCDPMRCVPDDSGEAKAVATYPPALGVVWRGASILMP